MDGQTDRQTEGWTIYDRHTPLCINCVITIPERHTQTDGQTDRQTDRRMDNI